MTLLDRLKRRPRWEDPDPEVRADAVRQIPVADQATLARIAREDADPRIRRAALRRLGEVPAIAAVAEGDPDDKVREEAAAALVELALGEADAADAALRAVADARQLLILARSAARPSVRLGALGRLTDPRQVALLARTAEEAAVRREAAERVTDPALLLEIALKSEHKDVIGIAIERLGAPELETVAASARAAAAVRRARARLEALRPAPPAVDAPAPEAPVSEPAVAEAPAPEAPLEAAPPADPPEPPAAAAERAQPTTEPPPLAPPTLDERESRERQRRDRLGHVEALCARLEALVKTQPLLLREADAALRDVRTLHDELAHVPGRLAERLKRAKAALFGRAQELREAEEWTRWANSAIQEELCARLEALAAREDLERVARELHECDARWSEARHAPRDQAEALRQRYQAARAVVKARLDAYFARKAEAEAENLKNKQALCERAEALADSTDWLKAAEELKALQAQWKQIGAVRHGRSEPLWKRFRSACDHFFVRREQDLKRRKEEWARNLSRKQELIARAESLAASSDWETTAAEMRKLQADWKSVGPVKKTRSEEVWQRFRRACDAFFERYKHRGELEHAERLAERESMVREIESLVPGEAELPPGPEGLAERVLAAAARLRQGGALERREEEALVQRFTAARDRLVAAYPASFRGTDLDPEASRVRREKLVARIESLAAELPPDPGELSGEALARRLKEALAANTIAGRGDDEARRREIAAEIESAQAAWKRLVPVPGAAGAALEERFATACRRLRDARRRAPSRQSAAAAR